MDLFGDLPAPGKTNKYQHRVYRIINSSAHTINVIFSVAVKYNRDKWKFTSSLSDNRAKKWASLVYHASTHGSTICDSMRARYHNIRGGNVTTGVL